MNEGIFKEERIKIMPQKPFLPSPDRRKASRVEAGIKFHTPEWTLCPLHTNFPKL